jgi:pimeloyl-ACP methyl ester carboxylesterase
VGPNPDPTSSHERFSKLNTTTESYRAGGAPGAPHAAPLASDGVVVRDVVEVGRARVDGDAPFDDDPEPHAPSRTTSAATPAPTWARPNLRHLSAHGDGFRRRFGTTGTYDARRPPRLGARSVGRRYRRLASKGVLVSDAIEPFRVAVGDDQLADLRDRLARTRWPEPETVSDWSQGIPLAYVQELCAYWRDRYDWRSREDRMNRFPQFRTELDGLGIHFLHAPSPEPGAMPLVLTHGWPGSVVEFLKVIEPLRDPVSHGGDARDAFHVVCPSLPGYGWSDKPATTGWTVQRIAVAWATLMGRLGYERFFAQGGDWGASVTTSLAEQFPERVAGVHLNMPIAIPDLSMGEPTERERDAIAAFEHYRRHESGYAKQQSTRPQTLGYGLVDSPAAQAAWIVEKFMTWSDCDGHPEHVFTRDELLDNVMLYWIPATGASSARLYWESHRDLGVKLAPVTVPSAVTIFPKELSRPSRRWAEPRLTDLRSWSEVERGGHFAAFERPETFVAEVRAGFRSMR